MKVSKIIISIVFAVAVIFASALEARTLPGDKVGVRVDTIIYDFGTAKAEKGTVEHEFVIKNIGTTPVSLISVKPKCGCTVPYYTREPIKPGKSAKVKVKFHLSGIKGEVDKEIRIRLKNGARKSEEISLRMAGVVVP